MSNKIDKNISQAVDSLIPKDMYERILQNLPIQERTVADMDNTIKFKKRRWIGFAAAFIVFVMGVSGGLYYNKNLSPDSVVGIDVNPSIEIVTNKNDKVIEVKAINSDADKILEGMQLKNVELNVAVNAVIGSMVKNGYILDRQNGILVTVQNDNAQKAEKIRNVILTDIDSSLKDNNVSAMVINQTTTGNAQAKQFAQQNEISVGKAVFINKLAEKYPQLNPQELAKMSIKDISALVKEQKLDISDLVDYDEDDTMLENIEENIEDTNEEDADVNASATQKVDIDKNANVSISADKAKEIAFADCKADTAAVKKLRIKLDKEDKSFVYELEFRIGNIEYDYEIDADSGKIIHKSHEDKGKDDQNSANSANVIGISKAKEIALAHANVSADKAVFVKAKLETEKSAKIYEIEFLAQETEYDYEIDATTGNIINYSSEKDD